MISKNEFELIKYISEKIPQETAHIIGIGDDAAVIEGNRLITTDALVDGVHFLSNKISFNDLGYKSFAVNISDIAAMGGHPEYALLTLGISEKINDNDIENFLNGINEIRNEYKFDIIGGDTVKSDVFFISITMIGKCFSHPILRNKAKNGDYIYVSGTIGDSGIGLKLINNNFPYKIENPQYFINRHYRPSPRVKLIEYLIKHYVIHSCIDISDGFLGDLNHIAEESNLSYFVDLSELPLSVNEIGESYEKNKRFYHLEAANSGEDYELIITSPELIDCDKVYEKTGVLLKNIGVMNKDKISINYESEELDLKKIINSFKHF